MKHVLTLTLAAVFLATGASADARYASETQGLKVAGDSLVRNPTGNGYFATPRKRTVPAHVTRDRSFLNKSTYHGQDAQNEAVRAREIYR